MKKWFLVSVVMVVLGFCVCGCQTETAYQKPGTQQIISAEDYSKLPTDQQQEYREVTVKSVKPEVVGKIETGLGAATNGYTVIKPFVPEPYATGGALLLAALIKILGMIKTKKIKGTLDKVSLGAKITATTIDNVVRPAAELFETFKDAQRKAEAEAKKNGLPLIMPDDL